MKKKKGGGGGANWMDTYGDMVTLLLCFFVLLYSMSTISEEKWRAIVTSFNPRAVKTPTETEGNDGPISDPENEEGGIPADPNQAAQRDIDDMIVELYQMIQEYSEEEGMQNTLSAEMIDGKIYVSFNETAFFRGNEYELLPEGIEVMAKICGFLDQAESAIEEIRFQGHTAQADTSRANYPEQDRFLSSNRATEVLLYVQLNSLIHPARLVSEGHGQWWPRATNQTAEGKAQNRRVEMIISGRNLEEELEGGGIRQYIEISANDLSQNED